MSCMSIIKLIGLCPALPDCPIGLINQIDAFYSKLGRRSNQKYQTISFSLVVVFEFAMLCEMEVKGLQSVQRTAHQ